MPTIVYLAAIIAVTATTYGLVVKYVKERFILIPKAVPLTIIIVSTIIASASFQHTYTLFTFLGLALFIGLCMSFWPWVYTSIRSWLYFSLTIPLILAFNFLTPNGLLLLTTPIEASIIFFVILGVVLVFLRTVSQNRHKQTA